MEVVIKIILILIGVGFWAPIFYWLYKLNAKNKVPLPPDSLMPQSSRVVPSGTREEEIKALYEYLVTRALDLEGVNDLNGNQVFPLWINIDEVYFLLSLHHNGELMDFLKEPVLCYDHGFGCDADDHELPEFPAEKSKK